MGRTILSMICCAVVFSALVGCTAAASSQSDELPAASKSLFDFSTPYDGQFELEQLDSNFAGWILRDKVTGCEYLSGDSTIYTPRLNADGVPMCNNTIKMENRAVKDVNIQKDKERE